jgi:hypothetical protein
MTRAQAVAAAFGLFAVWTLATYLLEARLGTFLRPDATSRFVHTVVANVLIGTIGAALVIRALVRRVELPRITTYGIARPLRILVLVPVAAVVAALFLMSQQLPTSDPVVLANASAQVIVVSIAEVVVCRRGPRADSSAVREVMNTSLQGGQLRELRRRTPTRTFQF